MTPSSEEASSAVTVAICTRNRADQLKLAANGVLGELTRSESGNGEILIVDNGSTDDTQKVGETLCRLDSSRIRMVSEQGHGLAAARNRALEEAKGDIVAFIDDDALVADGWLSALLRAFEPDDVVAVGGPIEATFTRKAPKWYGPSWASLFSHLDLGAVSKRLEAPLCPYGTNMAFRRSWMLGQGLAFPIEFDHFNDEIAMFTEIHRRRGRIEYVADMRVLHCLSPERATESYVVRRLYRQGQAQARLDRRLSADQIGASKLAKSAAIFALRAMQASVGRRLSGFSVLRRPLVAAAHDFGYLTESLKSWRSDRPR